MTYGTVPRLFARSSVRITILVLIGIFFMMFLYSANQARMIHLQELGNDIAAKTQTQFGLNAQYSLEFDENCKLCTSKSSRKVHVVTNFFPMSVIAGRAKILPPGANWNSRVKPNRADAQRLVEERDRELLDVLQMNLNNNGILAIHIIYHDERVVKHIMSQRLRFTHKLIFHWVQSTNPTYEDALLYIGKYLLDQLVVFTNQDIYLDRGWDVLDHRKIKERKLMYALTRHGKEERYCKMRDDCARSAPYRGSHDAFAFVLTEMPKEKDLALLKHSNDQFGVENIMIFLFREKLKYEVINPCFVLYIYHVHCAGVFSKNRVRVNRYDTTGMANFIDQLYV